MRRENLSRWDKEYMFYLSMASGSLVLSGFVRGSDSQVEVLIPKSLADRVGKRVASSEFKSVSDYVTFVLSQVIEKLEEDKNFPEE